MTSRLPIDAPLLTFMVEAIGIALGCTLKVQSLGRNLLAVVSQSYPLLPRVDLAPCDDFRHQNRSAKVGRRHI